MSSSNETRLPAEEDSPQTTRTRPSALLVETSEPLELAPLARFAWARGMRLILAPSLHESVLAELSTLPECRRLSDLDPRDQAEATRQTQPGTQFDVTTLADDAVIAEFHTSGSTGSPVRVEKRASQLIGEARELCRFFEIDADDRIVSGVPANHLYGFLFSVMIPMISGCDVIGPRPLHAESIASLASESDATILVSTPDQLRTLTIVDRHKFPDFKRLFSSGAALSQRSRRKLAQHGFEVTEVFGSTETGGIAWRDGSRAPVWTPLPGVQIREVGGRLEIHSSFAHPCDTWLQTDDRLKRIDDGFLHRGRADDIVKIGGKRVSKHQLLEHLRSHPDIADAALVELTDELAHGRLHALVEPVSGTLAAKTVREHLTSIFEAVVIPRIHIVSSIPRSDMGKVTRSRLEAIVRASREVRQMLNIGESRQVAEGIYEVSVCVATGSVYFEGHFEGYPILPGVVQVSEIALAQTRAHWPELEHPQRITRLKFHSRIQPDDALCLRLERRDRHVIFMIKRDGERCSSGRFEFPGKP